MTNNQDEDYSSELFARGFLFHTRSDSNVPAHWQRGRFGEFHLAHDPRLSATRGEAGASELLVLGVIWDVRHPDESSAQFVQRLADSLARSEAEFFEEIDFAGGRFVLAYGREDGGRFLFTDTVGMKSTFYFKGADRIVSSSPQLLFENAPDAEKRPEIPLKWGYPGRCSPVKDAFLLTPNTKLDLSDFNVHRFWPRAPIPRRSLEEATDLVEKYLKGAVQFLGKNHKPLCSLTGGIDSRVTLSLFKTSPGVHYFNYLRVNTENTSDVLDREFVLGVKERFGLPVDLINVDEYPAQPAALYKVQERNSYYENNRRIVSIYRRLYAGVPNLIHVRSSVSEVGREFFVKMARFPVREGKDLARIYLGRRELPAPIVFEVIEMFEDFARVSGFFDQADKVDLLSLFYWEFRMAAWQSQVALEGEIAFDTVSMYDCRRTIEALLSVTPEERADSLIIKNVIKRNWPELTEYPVNGRDFWTEEWLPGMKQKQRRKRKKGTGRSAKVKPAQPNPKKSETVLDKLARVAGSKATKQASQVLDKAEGWLHKARERLPH